MKLKTILALYCLVSIPSQSQTGINDREHNPEFFFTPRISLVMAPQDDALILAELLFFWRDTLTEKPESFPRIVAMEPGPLVLNNGLKLVSNEIPPRLSDTDLLIISTLGDLAMDMPFLAYLRLCLAEGKTVWILGDQFPDALLELPLAHGQTVELVPRRMFGPRLARYYIKGWADGNGDQVIRFLPWL